jgi:tryptophanyl-tRNA synthetase
MEEIKPVIERKPIILSGIQPSGSLHIGHLTGAIKNWVELQEKYDCYFTIVDLHAITVRQNPAELRKRTLDLAALYIACGIDPEKCSLFIQSHVPEHTQLSWVLTCYTGMGELERMTQFKAKSEKYTSNVNAGLFTYPILMASDILLYQADLVPVGEDQKQHLELTRDLANRFNFNYSDTFKVPEPYIAPVGARIMNLQDPESKMSKSDENLKASIFLTDSYNEIVKKIKSAVTDSDAEVKYDKVKKPGVSNLMTLYHIATGKSFVEIETEFIGKGYGDFKGTVGVAVADYLKPITDKYAAIRKDENYLKEILQKGAEKARNQASRTLAKVYKKVGFVSFK